LRRWMRFLAVFLLIAALVPGSAFAAQTDAEEPELIICNQVNKENLVGVAFELYYVARCDSSGAFLAVERFADFGDSLQEISDPRGLAAALEYEVVKSGMNPDRRAISDEKGIVRFPQEGETLEQGLYLVMGKRHVQNGYVYEMDPMLVSFPRYDEAEKQWTNHCTIRPKYDREEMPDDGKTDIKVQKTWIDKGYENRRPIKIKVKLMKDGEDYKTVWLTRLNKWSYTWKDLDADAEWTVVEDPIKHYKPAVTKRGSTFQLTNTYIGPTNPTEPTKPPMDTKLPQTGQLWWPVPVLLVMGLLVIAIGFVRRREECYEE